jgi:hypothetical protein
VIAKKNIPGGLRRAGILSSIVNNTLFAARETDSMNFGVNRSIVPP